MKSLNIDAVIPWEIGLVIIFCGFVFILLGTRQSKKEFDIENLPFVKPTTKIIIGGAMIFIGFIQIIPLLK